MSRNARRGHLSTDRVDELQQMNLDEVKGAFTDSINKPAPEGSTMKNGSLGISLEQTAVNNQSKLPEFDEEKFIQMYLDPATLEERPEYADGSAPNKAINKSPLSVTERAKLSFGNDQGTVKYLASKYGPENVQLSPGGKLNIKTNDGLWYNVDPNGLGEGDAWDKTNEIIKDTLGDMAGGAATVAATLGIGAAAGVAELASAGGATPALLAMLGSGAAGGVAAAARTSLGRLVGTYDATPEEQAKDVALEFALNAGGQAIALGVRPTAQVLGSAFKKGAETIGKMPEAAKNVIVKSQSLMTGVDESAINTWYRSPKEVGEALLQAGKGEVDSAAVAGNLIQSNIQHTKTIANETRAGLTKYYAQGMNNIVESVGAKFTPNISSSASDIFNQLESQGLGQIAKDGTLKLNPMKDLLNLQKAAGAVDAVTDPAGYKLLNDYVQHVNKFVGQAESSGKDGVLQMIKFEQMTGQKIRELGDLASDIGGKDAIQMIKQLNAGIHNQMNSKISQVLGNEELTGQFASLQKNYSNYKDVLSPILDAQSQYSRKGSSEVFTTLYDRLFKNASLTTKGATAKGALETALSDLGKFSPELSKSVDQIAVNKAAHASLPAIRPGLIGQATAIGGVASMNPAAALPVIASSPRINYEAAKMTASLMNGLNFVQNLPSIQKTALFQDPKMLTQLMTTVAQTPLIKDQVKQQALSGVVGGGNQNGQ